MILDIFPNKLIWGPNIHDFHFGDGRSVTLGIVLGKKKKRLTFITDLDMEKNDSSHEYICLKQ